jgi:hypothetical protein
VENSYHDSVVRQNACPGVSAAVALAQAPVITVQPQSISAATYSTSLRVMASATGLSYECRKDGFALNVPNSPSPSFNSVHAGHGGTRASRAEIITEFPVCIPDLRLKK